MLVLELTRKHAQLPEAHNIISALGFPIPVISWEGTPTIKLHVRAMRSLQN